MKNSDLFSERGELTDRRMREYIQRGHNLEIKILSLLIDNNIETEDALKQLDVLFEEDVEEYDRDSWVGFVTSLTFDVNRRCEAFDAHVETSTQKVSN